jgi:ubiquitin carboxyl-terminal hydrolase 9/13
MVGSLFSIDLFPSIFIFEPKLIDQPILFLTVMFNSSSQQDAHEFLMYLLNEISESLEKQDKMLMKRLKQLESKELGSSGASRKSGGTGESDVMAERPNGSAAHLLADLAANTSQSTKTFIQSIFQGTLTNDTRCLNCEMVTSREEHFLDVQVDIEQNSSVTHCLNKFTRVERLSGTNKFSCECCGSLQEAEKRTRFKSLPKILVLHLKRFKYLENPGIHAKLSHRVTFPVELRVPATMGSSAGPQTSSPANSIQYSQGDAPDPSLAESDDPLYYLSAMVAHLGPSAHSGHYVAFIRSGDKWLSMDDTRVQPVEDTETLMNRAFGVWNHNPEEPQNSASAYILFYERKPEVGRA